MRERSRRVVVAGCALTYLFAAPASPTASQEDWGEWLEVRSPHFAVVTDAGEERGRRLAFLLEAMRQAMTQALPTVAAQEGPPLEVFAARNRGSLERLLPHYADRDRSRLPLGVYFDTADKGFIAMREDADTETPYEAVYHEYFHSLSTPVIPWAPVWFREGTAGFWENTLVYPDRVETGRPSAQYLDILERERWMPLEDLLAADHGFTRTLSAHRSSIFYAQSWLIIHYALIGDRSGRLAGAVTPYLQNVMGGQSSVAAFEATFGELEAFERELRQYMQRYRFQALHLDPPRGIDRETFTATPLTPDQFQARLGSFFVHTGRRDEGRAALDLALQINPDEATAHEAMGVLHYRADDREEARASFERAVSLNGTLYLTPYYLALIERSGSSDPEAMDRARAHLERAVQMNPYHGPSLAHLAMQYAYAPDEAELALTLARRAAGVSPDYPYAYAAQGVAARENGLLREARAALEMAVLLSPDYEFARTTLEEVVEWLDYPFSGTWAAEGVRMWLQVDIDGRAMRCSFTRLGLSRRAGVLADRAFDWADPPAGDEPAATATGGPPVADREPVRIEAGRLFLDTGQGEVELRRRSRYRPPQACEPILD